MATVRNDELLDSIPTQRGTDGDISPLGDRGFAGVAGVAHRGALARARASATRQHDGSVLAPAAIPTQVSAPAIERLAPQRVSAPAPAPELPTGRKVARRRSRLTAVMTAAFLVVVLTVTAVVAVQGSARAAEAARVQARVAAIATARADDQRFWQQQAVAAGQREQQVRTAVTIVAGGQAALAAAPNAGDAPRAALQAAVDAVNAAVTAVGPSRDFTALHAAYLAVAVPQQAVADAQTAWQAAENARIAAEQAAAQAAAQQAAAQAAAAQQAATRATSVQRSAVHSTTTQATKTSTGSAPPAQAPATAQATAGDVFSAGAIGAELNAYRAGQGLGPLAIVSSQARITHAQQMAASNSIWHSAVRSMSEIVGRESPVSAAAMIQAYANSPSHNAIMLGNYSTAYVGAVTYDGWLYTSIQFG